MISETASPAVGRLLLVRPDPSLVRGAVRSGLDVWLVADEARQIADFAVPADRVIRVNGSNREALDSAVAEAIAKYDIDYALDGDGTPVDGKPSADNRAEDTSAVKPVRLPDDVHAVRSILDQSGLGHVGTRQADTTGGVEEAVLDLGFPAVIRSAEADDTVVHSAEELAEWGMDQEATGTRGPYVVEESLTGPRLMVTTLTADGMHHVAGIAIRRHGPLGPAFVYPAALEKVDEMTVRAAVRALLDLVGYQFGPAQTSVVLTSRGPRVVRLRSRFDVGRIPRLIELAAGLDVRTELFRVLAGAPFLTPNPRRVAVASFLPELVRGGAAIPSLRRAEVLALPGVSELYVPGVTGDESVAQPADIDCDRAYVITEGVSLSAALESTDAVRRVLG
jgi:hypothetical protein